MYVWSMAQSLNPHMSNGMFSVSLLARSPIALNTLTRNGARKSTCMTTIPNKKLQLIEVVSVCAVGHYHNS